MINHELDQRVLERTKYFQRGDQVEIIPNAIELREGLLVDCKASYIAGVATTEGNVVLLTLKDCAHPFLRGKIYPELRKLETIRKIINE
jgi:hypothetical protein